MEGSGEEEQQGVLLVLEGELILFDEINFDAEMYDFATRGSKRSNHLRTQHV